MKTFLIITLAQMADVATTFTALWLFPGYVGESNPLVSRILDAGPIPAVALKIGVAALCTLSLRILRPSKDNHTALVIAYILAGILPAINNIYIIIKVINRLG